MQISTECSSATSVTLQKRLKWQKDMRVSPCPDHGKGGDSSDPTQWSDEKRNHFSKYGLDPSEEVIDVKKKEERLIF